MVSTIGTVFVSIINQNNLKLFLAFAILTIILAIIHFFQIKKKSSNHQIKLSIKDHPFFSKMKYFKDVIIPSLNFRLNNPKKEELIKKFLIIKFDVFSTGMRESASCPDKESSLHNLENKIIDLIRFCETRAAIEGVPDIFIQKFKHWHIPRNAFILHNVSDICKTDYLTCDEKLNIILNIMITIFDLTLIDAVKTAKSLNGELDAVL